ncbi:MAG: hypothetical protein ABI442_10990 [Gemmatimonadaceae bacterium]
MRIRMLAAGFSLFSGLSAASAQTTSRPAFSFGVLAGGSIPVGFTGQAYNGGFQFGGVAQASTPVEWLDVSLDAGYQHLGASSVVLPNPGGPTFGTVRPNLQVYSGVANLVIRLPGFQSAIQAYAIAGAGEFRVPTGFLTGLGQPNENAETRFGTDAGLGVEAPIGRSTVFAEARYERIGADGMRLVPVSLGIRFR